MNRRPGCIRHCTSEPFRFFGRGAELGLLDQALESEEASVIALVGPGGQGKSAIVQHWLEPYVCGDARLAGVFFWSFYRGKDADLFLRELHAYAAGLGEVTDLSASYCVDHLLPLLRRERWIVILDGTEVIQHESGQFFGRFIHPEVGRLLEEIAASPLPGVVVLTSRFPIPELGHRKHARTVSLSSLDPVSARELLTSLGVHGTEADLDEAAASCAYHAKAVELLGTYLVRFCRGQAVHHRELPAAVGSPEASEEELRVSRVLAAFQEGLSAEAQDLIALATAFREPPTETQLLEYLTSSPVRKLLHVTWTRRYVPFAERSAGWLADRVEDLVSLRLLERVTAGSAGASAGAPPKVIDAHPLVRRAFEHVLGVAGRREHAQARAGFLRGRPDRRRPATLDQAREEIELFHAYCDAGLWNEADTTFVGLDNPKHRFLAPALERDLLLRFFPNGDWRQPPLWVGFGRYRSLAICFEMLGSFGDALDAYRDPDGPLRGDALLALGRLQPLLSQANAPHPWNVLWQAYRAHAFCLAGRTAEALSLAGALVPVDIYEWIHLFECLLRAGRLHTLDMRSLLYRPPLSSEHRWSELARERMRADFIRTQTSPPPGELGIVYEMLLDSYDRHGLPFERALTRLSHSRWLQARADPRRATEVNDTTMELAKRQGMGIIEADAWSIAAELRGVQGDLQGAERARQEASRLRETLGYRGPCRP